MNKLDQLKNKARTLGVAEVCEGLLDDDRFPLWSGSSKSFQHHYGLGGLLQHTYEVVELCFTVSGMYPQHDIDPTELFLAALFHDAGKMYDYEPVNYCPANPLETKYKEWSSTSHKRKIHHISRSGIIWTENARKVPLIYDKYYEDVLHAILAHHTCSTSS